MASFRPAITGQWVSKAFAALFPQTTVKETRQSFNKTELKLLQAALLNYPSPKQEKLKEHVLGKLVRMMG